MRRPRQCCAARATRAATLTDVFGPHALAFLECSPYVLDASRCVAQRWCARAALMPPLHQPAMESPHVTHEDPHRSPTLERIADAAAAACCRARPRCRCWACAACAFGAAVPDRQGQHHQARGHRHRSHGRPAALGHRHDGDLARPARSRPSSSPSTRSTPWAASSAARSRSSRKTAPPTGRPSPRRRRSCWSTTRVAAVFGCWTSASRKAVLPVFEKENGLLYYPTFYEGLEQSQERDLHRPGSHAADHLRASTGSRRRRRPRPSS